MRILHVVSKIDPKCGGIVSALGGLTLAQKAAGLDVRVLSTMDATRSDDSLARLLRDRGIQVGIVGMARGPLLSHPSLRPTMQSMAAEVDLVHVHGLWEEAHHQGPRAARRLGKPYVITPHGMLDPWSLRQSRWGKRLMMLWRVKRNLRNAAALHFTAEMERQLTQPLGLRVPTLIEANGLDLSEFESLPPAGTFRRRFPATGNRPLVMFLSRIHPKKGLDLLVPAFAKAKPALGDAMLVIVGPDNNHQAAVEAMIRDRGIEKDVLFTGLLRGADRVAALRDADLFALTSYQENFGIVVIEALAAGTPVLISDQVNIHDAITAAGVGQMTPMDVDAIAAELVRWMTDSALRQAAAAKARPFVWDHYDWNAIARRWVGHYDRLIGRAQGLQG